MKPSERIHEIARKHAHPVPRGPYDPPTDATIYEVTTGDILEYLDEQSAEPRPFVEAVARVAAALPTNEDDERAIGRLAAARTAEPRTGPAGDKPGRKSPWCHDCQEFVAVHEGGCCAGCGGYGTVLRERPAPTRSMRAAETLDAGTGGSADAAHRETADVAPSGEAREASAQPSVPVHPPSVAPEREGGEATDASDALPDGLARGLLLGSSAIWERAGFDHAVRYMERALVRQRGEGYESGKAAEREGGSQHHEYSVDGQTPYVPPGEAHRRELFALELADGRIIASGMSQDFGYVARDKGERVVRYVPEAQSPEGPAGTEPVKPRCEHCDGTGRVSGPCLTCLGTGERP